MHEIKYDILLLSPGTAIDEYVVHQGSFFLYCLLEFASTLNQHPTRNKLEHIILRKDHGGWSTDNRRVYNFFQFRMSKMFPPPQPLPLPPSQKKKEKEKGKMSNSFLSQRKYKTSGIFQFILHLNQFYASWLLNNFHLPVEHCLCLGGETKAVPAIVFEIDTLAFWKQQWNVHVQPSIVKHKAWFFL